MADVTPFCGILYNKDKIDNMGYVMSPPYDVISPDENNHLHNLHENNVVRLILGKDMDGDSDVENRHVRAAKYFNKWIDEDIFEKDADRAFYFTSMEFSLKNRRIIRYGLISLVKIEPFEKKMILPHEKTFSKVKKERLNLMKISNANYSQIFSLYSDTGDILNFLKKSVSSVLPDMDFICENGEQHKLWKMTQPEVHDFIKKSIYNKQLFIADGHHRYETALNYRNWVKENSDNFTSDHPANYIMMYLCSMDDPGLVVLPAHRMVARVEKNVRNQLVDKLKEYFEVETITVDKSADKNSGEKIMAEINKKNLQHAMAMGIKDSDDFYILTVKQGVMEDLFKDEIGSVLLDLDVTILTHLILMKIIGFDKTDLDDETLISYSSDENKVLEAVSCGDSQIVFLLNATKTSQVQNVAESGFTMPRKTTYFYPKVLTGQVLNTLKPS